MTATRPVEILGERGPCDIARIDQSRLTTSGSRMVIPAWSILITYFTATYDLTRSKATASRTYRYGVSFALENDAWRLWSTAQQ